MADYFTGYKLLVNPEVASVETLVDWILELDPSIRKYLHSRVLVS